MTAEARSILVTGGAGFIGSHVAEVFLAAGWRVVVIDDLSTGVRANLPAAATFVEMDICDAEGVARLLHEIRPEVISHHAALANVRESFEEPQAYVQVNVIGTLNLATAAAAAGTRQIIFASTGGALYGDAATVPTPEQARCMPLDPYGTSKLAAELMLRSLGKRDGMDVTLLRYPNVYGPRQDPFGEGGVVAVFTNRMLSGEPTIINGDGEQRRDFTFVGDIARANLLAVGAGTEVFNLGTGRGTSVNELYDQIAEVTGYARPRRHGPARAGEVRDSALDASHAGRRLDWHPQVGLADGLRRTVESFRSPAGAT